MNKFSFLFLMAIGLMAMGSSCKKSPNNPEPQENVCNTKDPINDLHWLKVNIERIKKDNCLNVIYQYDYNNQQVYYIGADPVACYEPTFLIVKCTGDTLCHTTNALTGKDNCDPNLFNNLKNKKLIYKK